MSIFSTIPAEAYDLIGVAGFGLYVMNYTLLTFRKISSDHTMYFVMNLLAAGMVMVGLMSTFNLASALIQGFWIAISIIGIATRIHGSLRDRTAPAVKDIPADVKARLDAIESRIAPKFVSRRQPVVRLPDVSRGTYSQGRGSGRKIPLRVVD